MFMVEIDGMRLLYTGDYSRAADRHMSAADLPSPKPHIGVLTPLHACQQDRMAILHLVAPTFALLSQPSIDDGSSVHD